MPVLLYCSLCAFCTMNFEGRSWLYCVVSRTLAQVSIWPRFLGPGKRSDHNTLDYTVSGPPTFSPRAHSECNLVLVLARPGRSDCRSLLVPSDNFSYVRRDSIAEHRSSETSVNHVSHLPEFHHFVQYTITALRVVEERTEPQQRGVKLYIKKE